MYKILVLTLVSFLFLGVSHCFAQSEQTQRADTQIDQSVAFDQAMKQYRQRHFARAIDGFNHVLETEPNNAAAYYFMGYAHYVLGHPQQALEAFSKAFQADPKFDPNPYMWLQ